MHVSSQSLVRISDFSVKSTSEGEGTPFSARSVFLKEFAPASAPGLVRLASSQYTLLVSE